MFAGFRMNTSIGQQQPFYRTASHQMRRNNFSHIRFIYVPVPDRFRIDDNGRPMFALIQAAGLVDTDRALQAGSVHGLLQLGVQLRFAVSVATGTRTAGLALVDADKHVPPILCQKNRSRKKSCCYLSS